MNRRNEGLLDLIIMIILLGAFVACWERFYAFDSELQEQYEKSYEGGVVK